MELASEVERLVEERIKFKIVQSIVDTLEENFYPPEEMFNQEFIRSVEQAEKEKGKVFKNKEELEKYLDSL